MCSSARWPSGSTRRWAAGDGGRLHRRPEGDPPGAVRDQLPGAVGEPVVVLQVARRGRLAAARPARAAGDRDQAAVRRSSRQGRDGTEIDTDEGKLFLDSVLDMGSRRVVGFAMDEHHDAELAHAALAMAVAVRGGKEVIEGVIMHTDQGSEYTAKIFRAACDRMGIKQSMGRVGSALDNAVIESWHSTLEFELRGLERFATKAQARARVAVWIDEYNRDRKHSSIGMRSPLTYELALRQADLQGSAA